MELDSRFIVFCEKLKDADKYAVRFAYNKQLLEKIKSLPPKQRSWNPSGKVWEVSPAGLFTVILAYRKSNLIFFDFMGEENKKEFISLTQKEDDKAKKKVYDLKKQLEKNDLAIKFKKQYEENPQQFAENVLKNLKEGVKLFNHQIVAALFLDFVGSALLSLEMGLGKANPLYTKILTPNGWVRMGDIKMGDQVIGSNGESCNVTGVFPQGEKEIYRVWFNDGTYSDCCDEHLWAVNTPTRIWRTKNGSNKYSYRILTLRQIIDEGLTIKNGNRKHYIPIVDPIQFKEKKLLIDPYLLGCLLGDGGLTEKTPTFSSIDNEILFEVEKKLPDGCKLIGEYKDFDIVRNDNKIRFNPLNSLLENYNLSRTNSYTKFIPNDYKYSSIEQRLELLRGLLDTDGHVFKDGSHVEITLASKQLIDDLQFIVQSLGGIGRIKDKWITYNGEKRLYYRMGIKLPSQFIPFKLSRKVERYVPITKYHPSRAITKVDYIGRYEAQCISVDAPDHLYLTDHCIVTHNTLCSIAFVEMKDFDKVFVVTPNSLKFNFFNEVKKFTNSKAHIIGNKNNEYDIEESKYIIFNYEFFNKSNSDAIESKLKKLGLDFIPKCIICDESHKLKNTKANTYKNFKKLFKKVEHKVFLSGTPAPNRIYELYTTLNQISPIEFSTKKHFLEYYCGMVFNNEMMTWETANMPKLDELYNKLSAYTYRRRKEDVLDLPEKMYQKILIEMDDKQLDEYREIEEGVIEEIMFGNVHQTQLNPLTVLIRLRQFTARQKIAMVSELLERLMEENEKVVVVDMFKENLYEIHKLFPEVSAVHTGDQTVEERNVVVSKFQDPNSSIRMFLGSVQTCSYGLTLTASNKMFIITLPFSVGEYDQVSDRIHRIGQNNNVTIFIPQLRDTIDEKVYDLVDNKRKEISKAIDNVDFQSKVSESILNDLIGSLRKKYVR